MIPDDEMKQLIRELGRAINNAVAESERVGEVVAKARASGLDFELSLDGTVKITRSVVPNGTVHILRSMHLGVEFDQSSES
jgi:hypothetical protein